MSSYIYHSHNRNGQRRGASGSHRAAGKQYIDPAKFVKVANFTKQEEYMPLHKFKDFAVNEKLMANLTAKGYDIPTPIQDQTIPLGLDGRDVIGIANTGTGKTAAFAIPVLNKLMSTPGAKALIVAPTRELAQQIETEFRALAKGSGLFGTVLIGGANIGPQLRDLRSNPQIVIGTPGRIKDHLERKTLQLEGFKFVVLDEVDRMLDMGFVTDVRKILSFLHQDRQSFFFSATLDTRVSGLIQSFAKDPVTVSLKTAEGTDNVHQDIVRYGANAEKMDKLHDALMTEGVKAIVFDDTQRAVERLSRDLVARGFSADAIHGGKSQGQRQRALSRFKGNEIKILVATDVAARGIDIVDITHVINFSTPKSYEDYIHRIGRAGRAGRTGYALTFVER